MSGPWAELGVSLPGGFFQRNVFIERGQVKEFRIKHHNTGIYQSAYWYSEQDIKNATLYGDLYLDFDSEADFELARRDTQSVLRALDAIYDIPPEQTRIYFSGKKGLHVIVPAELFGVQPHARLNLVYRAMVEELARFCAAKTLDIKIYDARRLFRIPNSIHQGTNYYKVRLSLDELNNSSYYDITKLAKTPRADLRDDGLKRINRAWKEYSAYLRKVEEMGVRPERDLSKVQFKGMDYIPPCIQHLLDEPVTIGSRNETVALLSSFLQQQGLDEDATILRLIEWNAQRCEPPVEENELTSVVKSIYRGGYRFGCSKARLIAPCDNKNCKMARKE